MWPRNFDLKFLCLNLCLWGTQRSICCSPRRIEYRNICRCKCIYLNWSLCKRLANINVCCEKHKCIIYVCVCWLIRDGIVFAHGFMEISMLFLSFISFELSKQSLECFYIGYWLSGSKSKAKGSFSVRAWRHLVTKGFMKIFQNNSYAFLRIRVYHHYQGRLLPQSCIVLFLEWASTSCWTSTRPNS